MFGFVSCGSILFGFVLFAFVLLGLVVGFCSFRFGWVPLGFDRVRFRLVQLCLIRAGSVKGKAGIGVGVCVCVFVLLGFCVA